MSTEPLHDEEWLRREYVGEGRSMRDIAGDLGCSDKTVKYWLAQHGIPTRGPGPDRPWQDETWLVEQYWGEWKSMEEIAEGAGCSVTTLIRWMDRLGVPRRPPGHKGVPGDELMDDVMRVCRELDKCPTRAEYEEHGNHSSRTVARHFGRWAGVKTLAWNRVRYGVGSDD